MHEELNYKNNPLHSVGLKNMLIELTDHYGFEILFAYLNINCFNNNPSIASSVKFLKKTDWAREKVESFYLYTFKNLPKVSRDQYQLSPRDRIIPDDQTPGEPLELNLEDARRLREERESRAAEFDSKSGSRTEKNSSPYAGKSNAKSRSNDSARNRSRKPSNRTASTDENPWGLPKN